MNVNFTPEQGKACLEIENAELRKENKRLQLALKNSKLSHKNIVQKSENQKEEIKRLYKQREKMWKRKAFLSKENQRLNNVLNELEKWLEDKRNIVCGCGITTDYIYAYENVLDYLSELKESDK